MHFFLYFSAVICSSLLFSIGIPNDFFYFGSAIAGFSALALLYYVFLNCGSYKKAALLYGFFTSFVHLFSSYWLAFFENFAIFTLGASTLAYFFLALPFGVVFYYIINKTRTTRMFAFAAVWLLWECFKSLGFLAYPWGTAPMVCFHLKHFIQFIDTTGVWGLSFTVPLISACFGEILHSYAHSANNKLFIKAVKQFRMPIAFVAGLVILLTVYGIVVLNKKVEPAKMLNVVIVQQNSDPWDISNFEEYIERSEMLTEKAVAGAPKKPDLIIWSESSLVQSYPNDIYYYDTAPENKPFSAFLKNLNIPLFTGTPYYNGSKSYNSACLISPEGHILGLYSKIQLIAFAEYIPLSDNPFVERFFDKIIGFSSAWSPGSEYSLFSVTNSSSENIKFAAPICFEDAFPGICTALHNLGSELLVNMSNDSWSKTASAEYQHFVVSYYRAIELRTTLVRSTNSGFSVVVDPFGTVLNTMPLFKAETLVSEIPIYKHSKTPFAIFKNWFPFLIFLILMILMFSQWATDIKKTTAAATPSVHWNKCGRKKHKIKTVRRHKPVFAVKRSKSKK